MALQLKNPNKGQNLKIAGVTGAVIIGGSLLILNTFPHLKARIYELLTRDKAEAYDKDENTPIELERSTDSLDSQYGTGLQYNPHELSHSVADESLVNISSWSNHDLKSWLQEVSIDSSIQKNQTNCFRKTSILRRMLLTIAFFPLLSLLRKRLNNYLDLILNFSLSQFLVALMASLFKLVSQR